MIPIATDNPIATAILNEIHSIKKNISPNLRVQNVQNPMRQPVYIQIHAYIWQMYYDDDQSG